MGGGGYFTKLVIGEAGPARDEKFYPIRSKVLYK